MDWLDELDMGGDAAGQGGAIVADGPRVLQPVPAASRLPCETRSSADSRLAAAAAQAGGMQTRTPETSMERLRQLLQNNTGLNAAALAMAAGAHQAVPVRVVSPSTAPAPAQDGRHDFDF